LLLWLARSARRFDVVHFHGAWTFTSLAGSMVAKALGRPVVLSPHETLTDFEIDTSGPFFRVIKRTLRRAYLNWFDLIITASSLELRDSRHGVSRARVITLHHPVGSPAPSAQALTTSTSANLRIGFLGRLVAKKNIDLLIRVLATLPETVTLRIAGEGTTEFSTSLQALARECRVDQRIEWLGFVSDEAKSAFFESIDLLALPSAYECFGMAAAEAMVAGVPVLVSPTCGVAEVVAAGGGFIAAPTDEATEQILRSLFVDRSKLASAACRAVASARAFSLEEHGTRLKCEYESLLACRALDPGAPSTNKAVRERE
jgi:glycosyltransferase involved in cell wall biosynthesis